MFLQLQHGGRIGHPDNSGGLTPVAPSPIALPDTIFTSGGHRPAVVPREMTTEDIRETVHDFAAGARRADEAGFAGVEVHGGNGYLLHQFLASGTNHRTDAYGGSAAGRIRFVREVVEAVAEAIGPDRVGLRIAPGVTANGMHEDDADDVYPALVDALSDSGLGYLRRRFRGHHARPCFGQGERRMTALLEVEDLRVAYGKIEAVKGISFSVDAGEVVTLIGTNGAGKTTTLRTLSGLLKPVGGQIKFEGKSLRKIPAHKIVSLGLAHSPEGRHIFPRMTIEENLLLGAFLRKDTPGIAKDVQRAYDLFPILGERRKQAAGTLSGGEQQMLAMGRALMSQPKLLMLDEPSMGLSPIMMQKIMATIAELKAQGTTILLVEQNAQAALALADHGHVMEIGKVVLSGTGQDLLHDESVRKAYLGED